MPDAPSVAQPPTGGLRGDLIPLFLLRYDRETTRRSYRDSLARFFGTDAVTLEMAQAVTSPAVNEHVAAMEEAGYAAATINGRLSVLRAFYGWLGALRVVRHNPVDTALVRRVPIGDWRDQHVPVLTLAEARDLVDSCDLDTTIGCRDEALIRVLIQCCLRRGEAAGLDFEHVRQVGRHWALTIPRAKGGADQYVKAPDNVVASIGRLAERYGSETGPVFRSVQRGKRNGRRLSGRAVNDIVKRAAERVGLPSVTAHVLRHTGCTLALEGGASILQVQNHARHRQVSVTIRYVHQRDRLANNAADFIHLGM